VLRLSLEMGREVVAVEGDSSVEEIALLYAAIFEYVEPHLEFDVTLDLRGARPTTQSVATLLARTCALVGELGGQVLQPLGNTPAASLSPPASPEPATKVNPDRAPAGARTSQKLVRLARWLPRPGSGRQHGSGSDPQPRPR
jgi:hypothetical protein